MDCRTTECLQWPLAGAGITLHNAAKIKGQCQSSQKFSHRNTFIPSCKFLSVVFHFFARMDRQTERQTDRHTDMDSRNSIPASLSIAGTPVLIIIITITTIIIVKVVLICKHGVRIIRQIRHVRLLLEIIISTNFPKFGNTKILHRTICISFLCTTFLRYFFEDNSGFYHV